MCIEDVLDKLSCRKCGWRGSLGECRSLPSKKIPALDSPFCPRCGGEILVDAELRGKMRRLKIYELRTPILPGSKAVH